VYNLSAGEPMIDTDSVVIDACLRAMKEGKTHYAPVAGIPELRAAAAEWMNRTYGTDYRADNCVVTCGGKYGINVLIQAFVAPGEEVLIIAPYWVSYTGMVKIYNGVPVVLPTKAEEDWKIKPEQIAEACNEKTKMLILNNAANPTGVLYGKEELEAILKIASEKNLIVLSDEVYGGLVFDGREFVSAAFFPKYQDKVIVIQSCSKMFAMTGFRVGFVFGPPEIINAVAALQSQSTTGTSTISQWAAVAGFKEANRIVPKIREEMQKRRDAFVNTFNNLFPKKIIAPASGLYAFIPIAAFGSDETDSVAFCARILDEANVAMVPGAAFGKEGYVRCSFGERVEELKEGLEVVAEYLKRDGGH